jgi:predicted membrane protein
MAADTEFRLTPRLVLGMALALLGVLLTLDNLGVVDIDRFWELWPLVLVGIGVSKILQSRAPIGILLTVVGSWLLLENLGYIRVSLWSLWPMLLVLLGGALIWEALHPREAPQLLWKKSDSRCSGVAIMGGIEQIYGAEPFLGGDLTAIMGGCEVDLTRAVIEGEEAVIDAIAIMGAVELKVPDNWSVVGKVFPLMGAFEDKTRPNPDAEVKKRLIVRGLAFMGGVEVKN